MLTSTALVVLSHSGAVNWSGKMMYVTSSHDIVVPVMCYDIVVLRSPRRYRRSRSYDSGPIRDLNHDNDDGERRRFRGLLHLHLLGGPEGLESLVMILFVVILFIPLW